MDQQPVLQYRKGSLSGTELSANVQDIWSSIRSDSAAREELSRFGIPVDRADLPADCPFVIVEKDHGLTATEVLITVGVHVVSAGTYDVLKDLWLKWVAPKLKARVDDALGPPADDE